jgi:hypothetical protein
MTARSKPTAREAWDAIDEASFRAEVDRVVAMTDEAVEAELLRDGFDPADLAPRQTEATTMTTAEPPQTGEPKPAPVRRLPVRRQMVAWLVAANLALVAGAGTMTTGLTGGHAPSAAEQGAALRDGAKAACAKAQWRACLDDLDEADRVDPGGADEVDARELRQKAERALGGGRAPR